MFEVQQATAGEWAVVVADRRALLVDAGDDAARLGSYRRAVASGFSATLEALSSDGFARTPAFALVELNDRTTLVAVRGSASVAVTVGDTERAIDAVGVSTWSEQQVTGVTAGRLSAGEPTGSLAPLPLVDGTVWAATVAWPATEHEPTSADRASAPSAAKAPITAPIAVDEAEARPAEPEPEPVPIAAPPTSAPAAAPVPTVAEATIAAPGEATGYDHLFGATLMRSVEDAAVRPDDDPETSQRIDLPSFITDSTPPSASERDGDHDGMTVLSGSLSGLLGRDRPDKSAASPTLASHAVAPRFFVDLFDGRREYLEPPIVVGRAPVASTTARGPAPRPITVTSVEQDISRSHASIAVEGDSVVVTDLHSRNGTLVVLPGKAPQKLRQGEPTTVIAGTVVDLGSGVTLTVGQDA